MIVSATEDIRQGTMEAVRKEMSNEPADIIRLPFQPKNVAKRHPEVSSV
jgi:hypothetical protein